MASNLGLVRVVLARLAIVLVAAVDLLLAGVVVAQAQSVDSTLWGVNPSGAVLAVAREGNTVYIGGNFSYVGPNSGGGVPIDVSMGHGVAGYPKVAGRVNAAVADGRGGWYIGGWFSAVNGCRHANLAHVGPTSVDEAWSAGTNNEVVALALSGQTLYVGGDFDSLSGAPRSYLGAVAAVAGTPTEWDPQVNNRVRALLVHEARVYAGGRFTTVGGQTHKYIAAIDSASGLALAWEPSIDAELLALALRDSTLFLGGYFANVGGVLRRYLAAVDLSSGALLPWNAGVNRTPDFIYDGGPRVAALLVQDSLLYVAGSFKTIGGQYREGLAAVNASTALATLWNPRAHSEIVFGAYFRALAISGDTLFAAGQADSLGGVAGSYLAALSTATAARLSWDPRPNWEVYTLAASGGVLYAGGGFNSMSDWVPRRNLAALDATTGAPRTWAPEPDDCVETLLLRGNTVYVGGAFSSIGGAARARVAALDTATGLATSWNPSASGGPLGVTAVYALAPWRETILVGGGFSSIGGVARNNLAAVDTVSGLVTAWNPDADDIAYCIVPADSVIYVGGWFAHVGGVARQTLAAVDAETGAPAMWAPSTDFLVHAMTVLRDTVYVGGPFNFVNGVQRDGIAAIDASGELTSWVANAGATVYALASSGNTIYAGGAFLTIGGQSRSCLAALDARTGAVLDWNPSADGQVLGLALDGDHVYAVGAFGRVGNWPQSAVAEITSVEAAVPRGPAPFTLSQSIPNPSAGQALIRYTLPAAARVTLAAYDVQGRRVATWLDHEPQSAGTHEVAVRASAWRPGMYLYRLEAGGRSATRKMIVGK
jgi:hypothetical protein